MQIRVKIHKVFENKGAMKAVASVTIGEEFAVHGVKLIETENSRFAAMPNEIRKDKEGNFAWPGFGQNMRVLKWIVERANGQAKGFCLQLTAPLLTHAGDKTIRAADQQAAARHVV